jgi:hypothetical protein
VKVHLSFRADLGQDDLVAGVPDLDLHANVWA